MANNEKLKFHSNLRAAIAQKDMKIFQKLHEFLLFSAIFIHVNENRLLASDVGTSQTIQNFYERI